MRQQEPPYTVKIELTEGCNLRCTFCGLQGIREDRPNKNYKFATHETITAIATRMNILGWRSRFELAMHGEPSMNPNFIELIGIIRQRLPKNSIMMTSNGGGFLPASSSVAKLKALFAAGLNVLALDDYQDAHIVGKIRDVLRVTNEELSFNIYDYPEDARGNPHDRRKPTDHDLCFLQDITQATKGTHSVLNNGGRAAAPPNQRRAGRRCARPFRELAFRWDGSVALCCNDWRGEYRIGNIHENTLNEIWQSDAFNAARQKLYMGERDFGPCDGCDSLSYRTGLLPDSQGAASLPPPDTDTIKIIDAALTAGPYTKPVLRPWEEK